MQNFDPKMHQQDVSRKTPADASEKVLKRRERASNEDEKEKKKFSLGEKSGASKASSEEKESISDKKESSKLSPFNLVSLKKPAKKGSDDIDISAKGAESKLSDQKAALPFAPIMESTIASNLTTATTQVPKNQKVVIAEMVKLLVKAVTEVKQQGKTETTITLQHPPMLAGAKITLTAFDSAKGEFNIKFTELSNQAKQLIDMQSARDSLLNNLAEKGYVVHIMTTTTQRDEVIAHKSEDSDNEREERGDEEKEEQ